MTRSAAPDATPSLARFTRTAETVADDVIGAYSTSFGLATRLLGRRHRTHVRNVYALVRVADEIVDGVASEAGLDADEQAEALERYIDETHRAMRTGYSSDLVVHAFARTARECGIDETLTGPFFDSMRADLAGPAHLDGPFGPEAEAIRAGRRSASAPAAPGVPAVFDAERHAAYVHGSAEVVGLMCLRVFLRGSDTSPAELMRLEHGARRLGAAFQNVNFLRDLGDDTARLGRSYLGVTGRLTDAERDRWVDEVRAQLADAEAVLPLLPADARAAVRSALLLFDDLANRVARTPAAELYRRRIRVPDARKCLLAGRAVLATLREGRR